MTELFVVITLRGLAIKVSSALSIYVVYGVIFDEILRMAISHWRVNSFGCL